MKLIHANSPICKATFKRRISAVSNAIQTIDNEANHLIIYCLNCIRHGRYATYEPGLTEDIHRPRIPAAHNGLSKARGCLWYSLANWEDKMLRFRSGSVADLGEGAGPQLFWVKREEMTEGKKASRASKSRQDPPFSSRSGSATEDYDIF